MHHSFVRATPPYRPYRLCYFFFHCSPALRDLHSFPTRRSSDLLSTGAERPVMQTCIPPSWPDARLQDRKSTRLNSSHITISYAVFCLKKKKKTRTSIEITTASTVPTVKTSLPTSACRFNTGLIP